MACIPCGRGIHNECLQEPCCCSQEQASIFAEAAETKRGRKQKPDDEITVSAGRKRAAVMYKPDISLMCEWRLLANAGGGKAPIVGCINGFQQDRHHGPVKLTSRNERSNIHLICKTCHNRWHAANDLIYDEEEYDTLPHDPRPALPAELLDAGVNNVITDAN